jgi:hypothetical protein
MPASLQIQDIHDQIMREILTRAGGYEIMTEGDSFIIAFSSVAAACAFCVEVQYRLLEVNWSKRVLALPACKIMRGAPKKQMSLHVISTGVQSHVLSLDVCL